MLRRLILVAAVALATASPAAALSRQNGTLTMDDGVAISYSLLEPDGAAPAGGWPGLLVLHGLGGSKESVEAISTSFASAGYAVLAYDARGHGASGGDNTLAGPREVADLRAIRNALAGRPEVGDRIGAWGISYGGGQIWNALAAGVPLAAAEVVETWTSLYDALWPQNLARSGIVAGFAASVAPRSPLIAGLRDKAVQSTSPAEIRAVAAQRSALPRVGSITTPVYLFQGRIDFAFDLAQATTAYARLAGPKRLYVGNFGHTPSSFPGSDITTVLALGTAWFDAHVRSPGTAKGADSVTIARAGGGAPVVLPTLPRTTAKTFSFAGRSTLRGGSVVTRAAKPLPAALETWGGGTATVVLSKLRRYPRLVVTVTANGKVVTQGGLKPKAGLNRVQLASYCVYVPKGARLKVSVGPASPPGQFAYLGFGDAGSAALGPVTLRLSTLAQPVSR